MAAQPHMEPQEWRGGAGMAQAPEPQSAASEPLVMGANPLEMTRRTGRPVSGSFASGASFIDCFTSKRRVFWPGLDGMVS